MKLCEVTSDDLRSMEKRYQRVLGDMEDARKEELLKVDIPYKLDEALFDQSFHSKLYLKYVLSRRLISGNLFHVLNRPTEGTLVLDNLRLLINDWEDQPNLRDLFNAKDDLDVPYAMLRTILEVPYTCSCGKTYPYMSLLTNITLNCSCGKTIIDASSYTPKDGRFLPAHIKLRVAPTNLEDFII